MATRTLSIVISGDASGAKKALADLDASSASLSSKFSAVGDKLTSVGKKMSAAITLPVVGLGAVAFNAASDLNESMSKVNVVFGENADVIQDWSKTTATALGVSRQEALEAAGTFGNLFTSMGLGQSQAADMSTQLVKLASDLASFNNISPEEALEKLRSGLVGEIEPLRSVGVNFNAAQVEAKAMALGLADANGNVTEAAKVQARFALILEQTTNAQGDFARTSSGAANQQRILAARFKDTAANIGNALLPIGIKLLGWLQKVADWFNHLSPSMQKTILIVAGLAAVLGPLVGFIGAVSTAIGGLSAAFTFLAANPIVLAIAAIAALVAGVIYAYQHFEGFRETVDNVISDVSAVIGAFIAGVRVIWRTFGDEILAVATGVWEAIYGIVKGFLEQIKGVIDIITGIIHGDWSQVWDGIKLILKGAWDSMKGIVTGALDVIKALLSAAWQTITGAVSNAWNGIRMTVAGAIDAVVSFVTGLPGRIGSAIGNAFAAIPNAFRAAVNGLIDIWNNFHLHFGGLKVLGVTLVPSFDLDLPNVPHLAQGAIVKARPGGTLALVGEGGRDEAVVPLDGRGRFGSNAPYVDLRGSIIIGNGAERELLAMVERGARDAFNTPNLARLVGVAQ